MNIFLVAKSYWSTNNLFFFTTIMANKLEKGFLQDMDVGDILHDKPISPDDAVFFIQGITIPETRVDELNLTFMSDSLHKFIRWP